MQRAPIIQRLGGCGSDCRGGEPVPQGERPAGERVAKAANLVPLGGTGRLGACVTRRLVLWADPLPLLLVLPL